MAITLAKSLRSDPVSRLPLRQPAIASADATIEQIVRQMVDGRSSYVLLQDGGKLVGIFTERDFVNRVVGMGKSVDAPIRDVMTAEPKTLAHTDSMQQAVELMGNGEYRHLPVLGETGTPVGVLSVKEIIHYLVEYFPAKVYNLPPTPNEAPPAREGA